MKSNSEISSLLKFNELTLQEFSLEQEIGLDYWHTTFIDTSGQPLSCGFGKDQFYSRKIAYSEFLERKAFLEIKNSDESIQEKWGINLIPTACGFAAGFNQANTVFRSMAEGFERWVMSQWIDEGKHIEQIKRDHVLARLDPASRWFRDQFDDVQFYLKEVVVPFNQEFMKLRVAFTIARKDGGVFPGMSCRIQDDDCLWQHALVESYRNLLVSINTPATGFFPSDKIHFFAKNADVAFDQINRANDEQWTLPRISLHRSEYLAMHDVFISRTIFQGWKSWNAGPVERFLY